MLGIPLCLVSHEEKGRCSTACHGSSSCGSAFLSSNSKVFNPQVSPDLLPVVLGSCPWPGTATSHRHVRLGGQSRRASVQDGRPAHSSGRSPGADGASPDTSAPQWYVFETNGGFVLGFHTLRKLVGRNVLNSRKSTQQPKLLAISWGDLP